MNNLLKKQTGITLISLVITIIVLLLLSAVTISTLMGNNGLLTKANKAKTESEIATEKELLALSNQQYIMKNSSGNKESDFYDALNDNIGEGNFDLKIVDEDIYVTFTKSKRTYRISNSTNIELVDEIIPIDSSPGDYTDNNRLDGSEQNPFEISSIEDLIAFGINGTNKHNLFKDKYIVLTRDLDFKSANSYANSDDTTLFEDYNGDNKVEGIMQELTNENSSGYNPIEDFYGTFDGQNHTIKNLYINNHSDEYIGFIEDINEDSVVKNLTVEGTIKFVCDELQLRYHRIGGIIGRVTATDEDASHCGRVENCISKVNIEVNTKKSTISHDIYSSPTFYLGGIIGNNEGHVNNCENHGNITIKFARNKTDTNSFSSYYFIGGISGKNGGSMQNCINYGNITYESTKLTDNYKHSSDTVGGITGTNTTSDIMILKNCINLGTINVKSEESIKVGGIVGYSYPNTKITPIVENCFNMANVTATMDIDPNDDLKALRLGGIAGDGDSDISFCYNTGVITHSTTGTLTSYLGSIVGDSHSDRNYKSCEYLIQDPPIKGRQGHDTDERGNPITPLQSFTTQEVIDKVNANVSLHNNSSEEKWIPWKISGSTILKASN